MGFLFNNQLPDVDKILQDWLNKTLGKGKGGKSNSKGGGGKRPDIRQPHFHKGFISLIISFICFILLVVYLFMGIFTVNANEQVVVFRLGKPVGVSGPGLRWHFPLLESYQLVNMTEVRRVEVGYSNDTNNKLARESLMLTSDLNIIDMQFAVQYDLKNAEDFLFNNRFLGQQANEVVKQSAETAMREIVGRSEIDFVLYEGRESIADEARSLMQEILDRYKTGIKIQQVAIQNVQPPDQVQNAFEDAIKARQDRERKINEGQAYANDILPRARGQAQRIVKDAEAYKASKELQAQGEAQRWTLLANEFTAAPELTRRRLYLETVEAVYQRANKIIIDEQAGDNNLLYLPLDKLVGGHYPPPPANNNSGMNDAGIPAPSSQPNSAQEFKQRLRNYVYQ